MNKKTVTIKTIAKEFNVTPATVSKALRDSSDISELTREKIKQLAKKMGYKPNLMARNLVSKKSNIIGVIVPNISTSFFGHTVRGVNTRARHYSYETIILVNDEDPKEERKNIEFLSNLQVEGIIIDTVPGEHNIDLLTELTNNGMPIVFVDRKNDKINTESVTTNDVKAGYKMTKYLIKNNRRNIAFIGSIDELSVANDRFNGYKQALNETGISYDENLIIKNRVDINNYELKEQVRGLIKSQQKFDGLICAGGVIAYLAGLVILEEGLSVPDDVFLAEFGDNNIVHRLGVSFATVDQFPFMIGEKALDILINKIENPSENSSVENHTFIKSKLIHHYPAAHKHIHIDDI